MRLERCELAIDEIGRYLCQYHCLYHLYTKVNSGNKKVDYSSKSRDEITHNVGDFYYTVSQ